MQNKKVLLSIGCVLIIATLNSGCQGDLSDVSKGSKGEAAIPTGAAIVVQATTTPLETSVTTPEVKASDAPKAKSVSLFEEQIPDFDGSGRGYIVDGNELQTEFLVHKILPLGLFMPETMLRFDLNGGTAWGSEDKQNYITIVGATDATRLPTITGEDPTLSKYKEYLGNYVDGEGTIDVFSFVAKGQSYRALIRTNADQRAYLRPLFMDMIRDIHYLEKRAALVAGVFVKEPEMEDLKEKKQILTEVMRCLEALVSKDKEKFNSTLYYTGEGDRLQYWIDNNNIFRFNELIYEKQANDSKRVMFYVNYEQMTSEGYYSERTVSIPLLRNKQGEWKVADID
ncbi:hypothetical protein [Paenibacillus wynnii]|uniref:hypothetical protein n=1 Tax=Paenibacillus wynnii TaxID=268407 RepID=UPI00278F03A1|nr:hypothetical protein [Paenibacillus wynnii]MDQ0194255.1 hypothetical protein [Paenibacillus wynnii]